MKIRQEGDPILREVAPLVDLDSDLKQVKKVSNLLVMATRLVDGYGIAANQIGYNMRMFCYKEDGRPRVVVNPTLVDYSIETWLFDEGCLSIPNVFYPIERPRRVKLEGFDTKGNELVVEADDLTARIFQHELDHLNGILISDRFS